MLGGDEGSSKSWFFAELLIEKMLMKRTHAVCVREVQKSLNQSVKKLLENTIERLRVGYFFEIQESMIKARNGGMIIFQGMSTTTSDSIKSLEGFDVCWVEEAQSLSQRSLDMLRPTIRKPKSEIWFSWNPDKDDDPVDAFLRCENPPTDSIVVKVNYMDNPHFPDVLREEMEYDKARDLDKYKHVWLGEYRSNSEARVFKNWKVQEFESPDDRIYYQGADWGFANDPTTLIRCYIEGRKLYVDYECYMVGCEIDLTPQLFASIPDSERFIITADSARPELISYMKSHGYPKIVAAAKGRGSVEDGIEFLKSFDIIVHPRCIHTIEELTLYSYKVDSLTGQVTSVLQDKNNHCLDALRYGCEGARRALRAAKTRMTVVPKFKAYDRGAGY